MALFLQESIQEKEIEISIEEAYEGLLEASMDMQELTEGLLQADFVIHEECKVLTEAEVENKQANFLVRAASSIGRFILKVRDKIVSFLTKLGGILKNLLNDIMGKKREIVISNEKAALVDKATAMIEKLKTTLLAVGGRKMQKSDKEKIAFLNDDIKKILGKVKALKVDKDVRNTALKSTIKYGAGLAAVGATIGGFLTVQSKEIKKIETEIMNTKGNLVRSAFASVNHTNPQVKAGFDNNINTAKLNVMLLQRELDAHKFTASKFLSLSTFIGTVMNTLISATKGNKNTQMVNAVNARANAANDKNDAINGVLKDVN